MARLFRNLPAKLKQEVLDRYRSWNVEDIDWWDFTYEDAKRMAVLIGIEIDEIQFELGYCQGDGACFTGRYECKPDAIQAAQEETTDEKLLRIATELTTLQTTLKLQYGTTFECKIERSERSYDSYHSGCIEVSDWGRDDFPSDAPLDEVAKQFRTLMRSFADWIFKNLQAEYEHLTSDEALIEYFNDNDYRFDAEGKFVPFTPRRTAPTIALRSN
jgi:hypothetical protein